MKNKRHNMLWISSWFILSIFLAILLQYLKQTKDGNYNWADSFPVWIGGAVKGAISAIVFLILYYLILRNININKIVKLLISCFALLLIIFLVSSRIFYNW